MLLLNHKIEQNKQIAEIQAEGVAYDVTRHFGLKVNSSDYLAGFFRVDPEMIEQKLEVITATARTILHNIAYFIQYIENKILGDS